MVAHQPLQLEADFIPAKLPFQKTLIEQRWCATFNALRPIEPVLPRIAICFIIPIFAKDLSIAFSLKKSTNETGNSDFYH